MATVSGKNEYDVAFLGDSLAALLTAALVVKKGCRALVVHNDRELPETWLTSSILLERILDLLDGRACLTSPAPFQVITRNQRVDCHGKNTLADELRREFPDGHQDVATFLDDMKALGSQLEEVLWDHQGLPSDKLGNRFRFRKLCFRADIPGRVFRQSLRERIAEFSEPGARKFLSSLFSGYSFTPSNKLTLAECALIWSGLSRESGIVKNGLEELLWHRYKQFHGEEDQLHRLARVRTDKDGSVKFLFEDDQVAVARHVVFAERDTIGLFEGLAAPPASRLTRRHVSGNLAGRTSPLLSDRVILDGNPPLRINLSEGENTALCHIENAALTERGLSSTEQLEKRLAKILPFVDLNLTPEDSAGGADVDIRSDQKPSLLSSHDRMLFDHGHKILCSGAAVVPELGTIGEVLVAVSIANKLLQATGKDAL